LTRCQRCRLVRQRGWKGFDGDVGRGEREVDGCPIVCEEERERGRKDDNPLVVRKGQAKEGRWKGKKGEQQAKRVQE